MREFQRLCANPKLRLDTRDLRSFQTNTRHQTALAERERVDILGKRGSGQALRRSLVQYDDARAGSNRPAAAFCQVLGLRHEKQYVAEGLHARL
jgi:hypothetical protein